MLKKWLVAAVMAIMLVVGVVTPVVAQGDLSETFIAQDRSFMFRYPEGWVIDDTTDSGAINAYNDTIDLYIYGPQVLAGYGAGEMTDPRELTDLILMGLEDVDTEDVVDLTVGGRTAVRLDYDTGDGVGFFLVITLSDGSLGMVEVIALSASGSVPDEDTALAIAATFDVVQSGQAAAPEGKPESLTGYAGDWPDVVTVLEDAGLIASGGGLVFTEDYAYFTGQGAFFTPLAINSPRTNFVMAGTLTYTPSDSSDIELCTLGSRIIYEGSSAVQYIDVGFANFEARAIISEFISGGNGNFEVSPVAFDLSVPHHFLILVVEDQATVYIDGELMFDDIAVDVHAGTWGVGLVGRGPRANCEARDIWVYEVPIGEEGVCEIRASGTVNVRSGPGTNFASPGQLSAGASQRAIGRTTGSDGMTWWQLETETWVRDDVIDAVGDCVGVPQVEP